MTRTILRLLTVRNETLGAFLAGVYVGIALVLTLGKLWGVL
jgi:hypothetical protein